MSGLLSRLLGMGCLYLPPFLQTKGWVLGALAVFSMVGPKGLSQAPITCGHTWVEFEPVRERIVPGTISWASVTTEGMERKGEDTHKPSPHHLGQLLEAKGMEAEL